MKIENAKYFKVPGESEDSSIICTIDGKYWGVPIEEENTHYIEIKRQLDAGLITIEASE